MQSAEDDLKHLEECLCMNICILLPLLSESDATGILFGIIQFYPSPLINVWHLVH